MQLFPEQFKIVNGKPVTTTSSAITGDYISLKDARRVIIIAELLQAATHATVLGYNVATAVAPTGATAGLVAQAIWKNADVSATDTLVKSTSATTIAATAGTTNQQLVMEIDPATLPAGYDCIAATLTASSEATNFATITYLIESRYQQATPPTAITD